MLKNIINVLSWLIVPFGPSCEMKINSKAKVLNASKVSETDVRKHNKSLMCKIKSFAILVFYTFYWVTSSVEIQFRSFY